MSNERGPRSFKIKGPNGEEIEGTAIEIPFGRPRGEGAPDGLGAALGAFLAGLGDMPGLGGPEPEDDHPLLKRLGGSPPAPFRPATKEEFMAFFKGWPQQLKVGDIVEMREGYDLDTWPAPGVKVIVSQVLDTPIRRGKAYTEQLGRRNDVALMFVENVDQEVVAAFAEEEGKAPAPLRISEFLYDSRRLKKVGTVFEE